jgi:hypothetical protein
MILISQATPIIVIQGTEDVFIDPKSAAIFSPHQLPPERYLVNSIEEAIEPNTVFVSWLKAGHEIIQERTAYLLSCISNLAKLYGVPHTSELYAEGRNTADDNERKKKSDNEEDDIFDILQLNQQQKKKQKDLDTTASDLSSAPGWFVVFLFVSTAFEISAPGTLSR